MSGSATAAQTSKRPCFPAASTSAAAHQSPATFCCLGGSSNGDEHSQVFSIEQEMQYDPCLFLEQADPPSSGQFLAAINGALHIIEFQCQKPDPPPTQTISLDALVPTPARVAQPIASADASAEIIDSLEKRIASLQTTVCQNSEHIAISENSITRLSATVCQNGTGHDLIILGACQSDTVVRSLSPRMRSELLLWRKPSSGSQDRCRRCERSGPASPGRAAPRKTSRNPGTA